jgi:hypothetical protein
MILDREGDEEADRAGERGDEVDEPVTTGRDGETAMPVAGRERLAAIVRTSR